MIPDRDRSGMAFLSVLIVCVLLVPLVFVLALRSRATTGWIQNAERLFRARLLACEGEVEVREFLRSGIPFTGEQQGSRGLPEGGMEYRVREIGRGDLDQPIFALAAEGIYRGAECLVFALVERFDQPPGPPLLIESDRSWQRVDPGGEAPTDLDSLLADHRREHEVYLENLNRERFQTTVQFLNVMRTSSLMLDSPDVETEWPTIEAALWGAKVK